jgi:hypothetical protein
MPSPLENLFGPGKGLQAEAPDDNERGDAPQLHQQQQFASRVGLRLRAGQHM